MANTRQAIHRTPSESVPPSSSVSSSPLSSNADLPKRKSPPPPVEPPEVPTAPPRAVKRLRAGSTRGKTPKRKPSASSIKAAASRTSSRPSTRPPSPEPVYRSSRSRSTSVFPVYDYEIETPRTIQKRVWCTQEHGVPGHDHLSSKAVVKKLIKSYKAFFTNPRDPTDTSFEPHPDNYPSVKLEYPNQGATEKFILLAPKDKDHYNPVLDLERTLYTIVEFYVPKDAQHLFGPIPPDSPPDDVSPPASPSPSPPCSRASSSSARSRSPDSDADADGVYDPSSPPDITQLPLLLAVQRAINLKDGPLFLRLMERVNDLLYSLKYPSQKEDDPFLAPPLPKNRLMESAESWTNTDEGLPYKVLMRIIEENYQRTVGPNVPKLKKYEAFSSTVYGELMPTLVYEILNLTGLKEDSLFLDLGSGVGNIVVQASLQTGCRSYGIELMPIPARVAVDTSTQMKIRCRMWGVRVGEMELEEGDMLTSKRVDELIAQADVVLVDNKVFEESLNEALRPKFLDLKEGAKVVSLSPFVPGVNARMTKRNVDDISAIFDVTERFYHSGSVSWGNNGGSYFIHTVDRAGYAKIKERFETNTRPSRSSRSRK